MSNDSNYNRHDIQPGWNHPLAKQVRELKLPEVDEQCLQAMCMWNGNLLFYKGKNSGVPTAISKQIGRMPSKKELAQSMINLQNLGYSRQMGSLPSKKGGTTLQFSVDKMKIKADSQPPLSNELFPEIN